MSVTTTKAKAPVGATILGAILGLFMGIGAGLLLQEYGVMSMASKTTLLVPAAGLLIGICAGLFGGRRVPVVTDTPVATAAPPAPPA